MKYSATNKPLQCMMTQSTCYQQTRTMTVKGVLWHSTGCNNPWLKRYVQPSDNASDRAAWLTKLGKNAYNNDWNHIYHEAGLNCWVGKLADGTVTTVQTMPWNYRPWGCGSGNKGSCNNGWIQFEICEDGLNDKKYFEAAYKEACEITAYLCKLYNIDPNGTVDYNGIKVPTILCHQDSYQYGLGCNHSDIYNWFPKFGYNMTNVRKDVAALLKGAGVNPGSNTGSNTGGNTGSGSTATTAFKKGDLVTITGTKYYSGSAIPSWVKAKNWYVESVSGTRVVINKSEDGKNAIMSPINAADLKLANTSAPATQTPASTATKKVVAKGIDVSKWQGDIDWGKVKAAGIQFAMVRLGYGSADGTACGIDNYFEKNVANAIKAGVHVGCYFYSYAKSVEAAKKEAAFVVGVLNKYKGAFTYPVAFDLEDNSQTGLGKDTLTNMVIAFGDAIEKAGFYAALYSNLNWLTHYLDDSKLTRFDHWLAQWASAPTYTGAFGMWQSSSTGKVNGINGNVDTDVAYKDYPTTIRSKKCNGFTSATQAPKAPATSEPVKPSTPTPSTPSTTIKAGDTVKITGSKYYSGATIPSWVKAKNWIVHSVSGDRVVIDKSVDGQNSIMSPVKASDLAVVSATQTAKPVVNTTIETGDTVKIIGSKYYSGAAIPAWVKAKNWIVYSATAGNDRIVINKSTDGQNAIMSPIKRSDLQLVSKK